MYLKHLHHHHHQNHHHHHHYHLSLFISLYSEIIIKWIKQASLGVRRLPDRLSDPEVLATLTPEIQHACGSFRNRAAAIVRGHRLDEAQFDDLYDKLNSNILFRIRVGMQLKKLESEGKKL